mgnify:CR=1 FL=1
MEYDAADRLVRVVSPEGRAVAYVYDAAGRLVRETNGNGETTVYERDAAGRLIRRIDPLGHAMSIVCENVRLIVL